MKEEFPIFRSVASGSFFHQGFEPLLSIYSVDRAEEGDTYLFIISRLFMAFKDEMRTVNCWFARIAGLGLYLLWQLLHFVVAFWYLVLSVVKALESLLISLGFIKKYKALNIHKLRYLAVVVDSEEARNIPRIVQLLQWLAALGLQKVCLFDPEGVLKKSKESILASVSGARPYEDMGSDDSLPDEKVITLEIVSSSDGKEAVAKAANVLFQKYLKSSYPEKNQRDQIFTETQMTEALRAIGCSGPDPDLLLVYGPVRCHLGFPAWRLGYTEIVHLGPLHSMRYGSLIKAIYTFTMVRQNYGR